jgi:predicted nucleic acid-binding protein
VSEYVYDTGALLVIDAPRNRDRLYDHQRRLSRGDRVVVPAVVAAQAIRDPARQAKLMLALRGCHIAAFTRDHHLPVGRLLARAGTSDVVDAFVALTATRYTAAVITSDAADISHLLSTLGVRLPVLPP